MKINRILLLPCACLAALALAATGASGARSSVPLKVGADWPGTGGDPGRARYSPLKQITRENVKRLEVAWTYRTGELEPEKRTTIECTPVVVDGTMYVTTIRARVVALDAATGSQKWSFDPATVSPRSSLLASGGVNRGVAYWTDAEAKRILFGAPDGRLFSLDAETGRPDSAFGSGGAVDLRQGFDRDLTKLPYGATSSPAIYRSLVILGFSVGEGPGPSAPGDIRAFDVRTGKIAWRFRTVPRTGESGSETWEPDSWKERGGANAWGGISIDAKNGMVFAATGSASFDFYGGDRKGDNLYANCVLALDANSGRRLWHFQTVKHDIWDYDNPTPPVLLTVRHEGRAREAVAQVTKTGWVYVLDRKTGKPLFPMVERRVPASDVPGEVASRVQVIPAKPPSFVRQRIGVEDLTDLSPEANAYAREWFGRLRYEGPFTPPSLRGTLVVPGLHGGATWSGASADPGGILYVNGNNVPNVITLSEAKAGSGYRYAVTGYNRFLDKEGYPAIKGPWGTLNAIDLNKGEIKWQVPLGSEPELVKRGFKNTGSHTFGGAITTAGGLVFIAGTKDEKIHAYDSRNGALLWEAPLPAGGYATPSTYAVGGRQYVVIAAGGGGKPGTRSGDAFVAFALPD